MKLLAVFISSLVLANGWTYVPSPQRLRRDVSELQLPLEASQDAVVLGKDDYKYKTVRTLRFRTKRDVSHLDLDYLPPASPKAKTPQSPLHEYLPPVEMIKLETTELLPALPSNEYLSPVAEVKETVDTIKPAQHSNKFLPPVAEIKEAEIVNEPAQPFTEYLPPQAEVKEAAPPQPSNEYLSPVAVAKIAEIITEPPQAPSNEYLPANKIGEDISEIPFETLPKAKEAIEIETKAPEVPESSSEVVEAATEHPQDTAVLEADGYHYKVPVNVPELFPIIKPSTEYLPPLEEGVVEAEGPAKGESTVLEPDGYHYRSIKRRF